MAAISDLDTLLAEMRPILGEETWVFVNLPEGAYGDGADLDPVGSFRETEGLTLIVPRARADAAGLGYEGGYRAITLRVHSSLAAVGLTAAVSKALADRGISANVVAACFHDHIFVPEDEAAGALKALEHLQQASEA